MKGTTAQTRRRARRQTSRTSAAAARDLVAAASGSTSLPLSARDAGWDSGAAAKTLEPGQLADAHFWKDPAGPEDEVGSYKLPFAEVVDGKLTAIWKGVVGAAGAIQGARGGVSIPAADVAAVKGKIGAYYEKARKAYDDDTIRAPWESDAKAAVVASLIAAGVAQPLLVTTYDLVHGTLAERFFLEQSVAAGHDAMSTEWWPTEAQALDVGRGVVFQVNATEQVVRFPDGTLAHVQLSWGGMRVRATGPTAGAAVAAFQTQYPASYLTAQPDGRVPITFWMAGSMGPIQRLRRIESQPWADIEANYSADARGELDRVMRWSSGDDASGQLLLWQGEPGTGKTWALRALASEWAPWAEFHYITDPDAFFGKSAAYMIDVLLSDSYAAIDPASGDLVDETSPEGKWKVLILEDTGDLLASNARDSYSAGLSRLLNVVDGMIGQGLRVLALVTTNDQVDDFHPAVTRPGRCASQLTFGPLTAEEASEWMAANGVERQSGPDGALEEDAPMTLAELFARRGAGADATLAMGACANCDHAFADHLGTDGPCTMETCDCKGFVDPGEASLEAALEPGQRLRSGNAPTPVAEAFVRIRPDMSYFRSEVEEYVRGLMTDRALRVESDVFDRMTEGVPPEHVETMRLRLQSLRIVHDGDLATVVDDVVDPEIDGGATSPAVPAEHEAGETMPARRVSPQPPGDEDEVAVEDGTGEPVEPDEGSGPANASAVVRWQAILCPEGQPTDDGRIFAPGGIEWRDLPLTLMAMIETAPGHDGAQVAGRIDRIWKENGNVMGEGVFDTGDYGLEIARMVGDGTLRGVSVDIAILAMEVAYRSDVLDAKGNWIGGTDAPADVTEAEDDDSPIEALFDPSAELMLVVWRGKIGAATVCPFPAFADATIELATLAAGASPNPMLWRHTHDGLFMVSSPALRTSPGTGVEATGIEVPPDGTVVELTAAGDASYPPAGFFANPDLDELTGLTVTDDGRIFGHAAPWDTCHIGIPDVCTSAPSSNTNYAYFHLKEVECDDGSVVQVGTITLDTGHAGKNLSRAAATRHYDDTGTAVADVVCGEDDFGIWFSGHVRNLSSDDLRKLRGASLSGDWRNVAGNLELVALLCVNVPGFPVPRVRALVAAVDGKMQVLALTAAGVHHGDRVNRLDEHRLKALADAAEGRYDDLLAEAEAAAA